MPRPTLKLLVLLTVFSGTPASAGQVVHTRIAADWRDSGCPYEQARLAALEEGGPTTITLIDRVPTDAPLLGRNSGFLTP